MSLADPTVFEATAGAPPIDASLRRQPRVSASAGQFQIVNPAESIFDAIQVRANALLATRARAGASSGVLVDVKLKGTTWILERERELDQLKELQEDWDTYGAAPPNTTAIRLAKTVVRELAAANLRQFRVEPSVEEGVCVSFRRGDVYADIEAFNSGDIVAAFSDGQGTPVVWDVESTDDGIRQATRLIGEHLKTRNS